MDDNRQELLEIYKLHANLADRVSQRREGANRLYVSLLTLISVLFGAFLRYGTDKVPIKSILLVCGVLGILLSFSWFVVIRSYRQLNSGKFSALQELENKLTYQFLKREWQILEEGKNLKRYWKLTVVETFLPIGFFAVSFLLIVIGLWVTCPP